MAEEHIAIKPYKNFTVCMDFEDYYTISESAAVRGMTRTAVIRELIKTSLWILEECAEFIETRELTALKELVYMPQTLYNLQKLNMMLMDFKLIGTLNDVIEDN
jgi:hypothetical protein